MPYPAHVRASDPLSEVLGSLDLRGSVFVRTEARAPWALSLPEGESHFHLVERGSLVATVPGARKPVHAVAGDLLVFPRATGHTIGDAVGRRATELHTALQEGWDADARVLRLGEQGAVTQLICGTFELGRSGRDALLSVLPRVLHLKGRGGQPAGNIGLVMQLLHAEARRAAPGSALCAARLVDLVLVQAIRHWLARQPASVGGWLGALRDPHVAAALSQLHAAPAHAWTVGELARRAGLSRSPFATRFARLVGEPPLRYLTRCRMELAVRLLRRGVSVRETAAQVGYASEAAFSRTFKRHMGTAPVRYRGEAGRPERAESGAGEEERL